MPNNIKGDNFLQHPENKIYVGNIKKQNEFYLERTKQEETYRFTTFRVKSKFRKNGGGGKNIGFLPPPPQEYFIKLSKVVLRTKKNFW